MCGRAVAVFPSFVILTGLIWSTLTVPQVSAVMCTCSNISLCEAQCNFTEANPLNCFRRAAAVLDNYNCLWNVEGYREYVLLIKQRSCKQKKGRPHTMSDPFSLGKTNVTIHAIAQSHDHKTCSFAKFSSSPQQMIHCGPPKSVNFKRSSGQMIVSAEWNDTGVKQYSLKYREHNTTVWKVVQSRNSMDCTVGNLTPSLSYEMQIQCLTSTDCPHCALGEVISVPQELVNTPDINEVQYHLIPTGQRTVVMKWEYVYREAVEMYNVTVEKASGEPSKTSNYSLSSPNVTLILSYSAYNISIYAFNKAGSSPATHRVIDTMEVKSDLGQTFNVTMNSNDSFSLSWNNTLSEKYHCYSVEWWETGEKPMYTSFYEKKSYHEVKSVNVSFQPYKRYHFLLHARPYKNTCNLKSANNSEYTYGRSQVYLKEGTPSTAPGNVSVYNITHSSFVITWNPVSEMELRGFLQGYIIRYMDTLDHAEKNITVESSVNSYKMMNMRSGTMYRVHVSAYTAAGDGLSNDPLHIYTKPMRSVSTGGMLAGVVVGIIALSLAVHFCFQFLRRSKNLIWPSVPNPYKSNAVQKIDGGQEVEMLELLYWQNLEGTEEHVSVVEVKACPAIGSSFISQDGLKAAHIPVLVTENVDGALSDGEPTDPHAPSTTTDSTAKDVPIDDNTKGSTLCPPTDAINADTAANMTNTSNSRGSDNVATAKPTSNVPFVNDYTTMELFQQIVQTAVQGPANQAGSSETVPSNSGQDYICQALSYTENL